MEARVASGVGVGVELAEELDVERCLLAGFPDRGRFKRLAIINEAAGQGPTGRGVLALDEDDAPPFPAGHHFDDDIDGGHGIAELRTRHLMTRSRVGARSICQELVLHARLSNLDRSRGVLPGVFLFSSQHHRNVSMSSDTEVSPFKGHG